MITFESKGDFKKTRRFLDKLTRKDIYSSLAAYGEEGVSALSSSTPRDTGLAASSWSYTIEKTSRGVTISWNNHNEENGFPVAVMIQYGHGTGTGGYVQGIDYINPAMRPVFENILAKVWKEVTSA